ncbi:MAG: polyprenyl diphosphate synthase [Candidatus Komeilibacteria bacterium]|nr:polyprenyl diphosphate synthase [Candidatus Komeilibacteria bacterium]
MENLSKVPFHLGIIMDGNRRWARQHGLQAFLGHQNGYETIKKIAEACLDRGIKVLTVYTFSTENNNRPPEEVSFLFDLLRRAVTEEAEELEKLKVKVQFLGRLSELPEDLQKGLQGLMARTKDNTKGVLNVALNYGGQFEIIDAVKKMMADGKTPAEITPELFQNYLYDPAMPPLDLIIRTSGEQRLSGFFIWEATYAELYFSPKLWPDFTSEDLDLALADYAARDRRFGGNSQTAR